MAVLADTDQPGALSPYFSRNYGGYSERQWEFIKSRLPDRCQRVIDPMAGQAFLLSRLAVGGADLKLFDHNPAPLVLAALRDPRLVRKRSVLVSKLRQALRGRFARRLPRDQDYSEVWLPSSSRAVLDEYADATGLSRYRIAGASAEFWDNHEAIFYAGIALLAARQISTFRGSGNVSWLKPGGFRGSPPFAGIVADCSERWLESAETAANAMRGSGSIACRVNNIVFAKLPVRSQADAVVTSPPYANRLDYSRMWAPEVAVFEALLGSSLLSLKREQLGSNVVKRRFPSDDAVARLPRSAKRTLAAIRDDKLGKDSATYYYPYFANYALELMAALERSAPHVRRRGRLLLFVRDTVRKDVLFEAGELCQHVMRNLGFRVHDRHLHVVRSHVGFRRKNEAGGLFGLAQREWWISFERA